MINNKEIEAVNLSPTKKDFYQIWNELLDTASKLSERWDPTSTNESDPGIVLLKVLTAVADKLNYNIDKNTLEAFMPSASQSESMRKLCDMLGYTMKYYRSATTDVTISYIGNKVLTDLDGDICIDRFTNIKDADDSINYVTLEEKYINSAATSVSVSCIEGELVDCETDDNNVISLSLLDDNQRYYLPETQIAENGIFVFNYNGTSDSTEWHRVDNLNIQPNESKVFKFGFDSKENLPYVQFPEDISYIIEDGLVIKYIRTNGVNGNVSANSLTNLQKPTSWGDNGTSELLNVENFTVLNNNSAINGRNPETITQAYNNYKKTIGTFNTLVTCRDYINKIYQMTVSDTDTTPLVSNVIVSDIRDDINRAYTLCTFNEFGVAYVDKAIQENSSSDGSIDTARITNFDLILYPFRVFTNSGGILETNTALKEYDNAFKFSGTNVNAIESNLANYKTISHVIKLPVDTDIVCIKNYLRLKAKITTTRKVNSAEEAIILKTVYRTLAEEFNLRNLDFGEEINPDDIEAVIKNADTRIKNVTLDDPYVYTCICTQDGAEYNILDRTSPANIMGNKKYNELVLANVLAGKIPLFNYNTNFKSDYNEVPPPESYSVELPPASSASNTKNIIYKLESEFSLPDNDVDINYTLKENENIIFSAPQLSTEFTWPAYVNYRLELNEQGSEGTAAQFEPYTTWLQRHVNDNANKDSSGNYSGTFVSKDILSPLSRITTEDAFIEAIANYGAVFIKDDTINIIKSVTTFSTDADYYAIKITNDNFSKIKARLISLLPPSKGLYTKVGFNESYGYLIDCDHVKYGECTTVINLNGYANNYYVPVMVSNIAQLGADPVGVFIPKNCMYKLKPGEKLYINYTKSATDENGASTAGEVISEVYPKNGEDIIIQPNFKLFDSRAYASQGHSYTKKVTFDNGDTIQLFTLGPSETIAVKKLDIIDIDISYCNIYWIRNDEDELTVDNKITWNWDDDEEGRTTYSYTLKEGEYFFWTDFNKLSCTYYGSGTKIIKGDHTGNFIKYTTDTQPTFYDIVTAGDKTIIPWQHLDFTGGVADKGIKIVKQQFVTLSEGDTINRIGSGKDTIGNKECDISDSSTVLYNGTNKLPDLMIDGINWSVKTRLNFNMSPTKGQTLNTTPVPTLSSTTSAQDKITVHIKKIDNKGQITDLVESDPGYNNRELVITSDASAPLVIKCNYAYQKAGPVLSGLQSIYDAMTETTEAVYDLKLKLGQVASGKDIAGQNAMSKFGKGLTKVIFKDITATEGDRSELKLKLNTNIPEDCFGLIMIYYLDHTINTDPNLNRLAYIEITSGDGEIGIFNYDPTTDNKTWWTEQDLKNRTDITFSGSFDTYNYLCPGINIIKVPYTCKQITIHSDKGKKNENGSYDMKPTSSIIISDLDLVYSKSSINPALDYRITDDNNETDETRSRYKQIMQDIYNRDKTHEFYYNAILDNSSLIDLHADEKLSDARIWYDYNNKANKFVVSELDTAYFKTGITLTPSSRL